MDLEIVIDNLCVYDNKNIEIVLLSEVSQTEKDKYHMILLIRRT